MTTGLVIRTPRLDLVAMSTPEVVAIRNHNRSGRMWARDYPTEDEGLTAELALHAAPDAAWTEAAATTAAPIASPAMLSMGKALDPPDIPA